VWCLTELGRFDDAAVSAQEAVQLAEEARHPHNIVAACWAAGYLDRVRGRVGAAIEALERGYALCQAAGVALWLRPTAALLGHACAWAGRHAEAIRLLEQAVRPAENNVAVAMWKVFLGEAYLLADRIDDAEDVVTNALALARQRAEVGFAAYALRALGAVAARQARATDAAVSYRHALELTVERGMLPLAARCHAALAALERGAGRTRQAAGHQAAADELCRRVKIDMQCLEPSERTLAS
jgi:tetratricopeptide (TPR) repeat protein